MKKPINQAIIVHIMQNGRETHIQRPNETCIPDRSTFWRLDIGVIIPSLKQ
jgi:hypothetical protein